MYFKIDEHKIKLSKINEFVLYDFVETLRGENKGMLSMEKDYKYKSLFQEAQEKKKALKAVVQDRKMEREINKAMRYKRQEELFRQMDKI